MKIPQESVDELRDMLTGVLKRAQTYPDTAHLQTLPELETRIATAYNVTPNAARFKAFFVIPQTARDRWTERTCERMSYNEWRNHSSSPVMPDNWIETALKKIFKP